MELCKRCPNNPNATKPYVKMVVLDKVELEKAGNVDVCEGCRVVKFLQRHFQQVDPAVLSKQLRLFAAVPPPHVLKQLEASSSS